MPCLWFGTCVISQPTRLARRRWPEPTVLHPVFTLYEDVGLAGRSLCLVSRDLAEAYVAEHATTGRTAVRIQEKLRSQGRRRITFSASIFKKPIGLYMSMRMVRLSGARGHPAIAGSGRDLRAVAFTKFPGQPLVRRGGHTDDWRVTADGRMVSGYLAALRLVCACHIRWVHRGIRVKCSQSFTLFCHGGQGMPALPVCTRSMKDSVNIRSSFEAYLLVGVLNRLFAELQVERGTCTHNSFLPFPCGRVKSFHLKSTNSTFCNSLDVGHFPSRHKYRSPYKKGHPGASLFHVIAKWLKPEVGRSALH
ncbi:hypothetical protein C8Q74DRAFT_803827 [Fomes fomentarius]|nr:hypothetical protein C8Q74DRAFT_803827 [Fomes fomentarius]